MWIVLGILLVCLAGILGVLLACSLGNPKPFLDGSGNPLPGSISEKTFVIVQGARQGMSIQSKDAANPVQLYVHGGMPEFFLAQKHPTGLEDCFTVARREFAALQAELYFAFSRLTLEATLMKKFLVSLPLLFILTACAAQPQATPDLTERVNATLTAVARNDAQITASPLPPQPTATQPPALSPDQLSNGAYTSPDWGEFQLANGIFYRTPPTSQESPEAYTTRLLDTVLYGDLNSDGIEDAVVFLATQSGGTGHFVEMAAVLNIDGAASNVSTLSLGDRVVVESGSIQDGVITLNMRVQGPNDGMCCPSQAVTWTFRLENGQLMKIS